MSRLLLVLALPLLVVVALGLAVLSLYEVGSQTGEKLGRPGAAASHPVDPATALRPLRRVGTLPASRAA